MRATNTETEAVLKKIYLIAVCSLLPLYMRDGYYELGEAKGKAFLLISGLFLVSLFAVLFFSKDFKNAVLAVKDDNSAAAALIRVYVFLNIISAFFAADKKTALLGIEGWRTGLLTILFMSLVCISFSRAKTSYFNGYVLSAALVTPFFSFILGILNRFGIYPVKIYGENPSFLATLGNINWYTGFLSIFVPVGIALGFSRKAYTAGFWACNIFTAAGLFALLTQGSESALLVLIGAYGLLFYLALRDRESFRAFLFQQGLFGAVMETVFILLVFFEGRYNYEPNVLICMCKSQLGLIILAAAFFLFRLSRLFEEISVSWKKTIYRRCLLAAAVAAAGILVIALCKGYDDSFGNGRGIIWRISADIYTGLTPWQKLFGVGQDCFYDYAYHNPKWAESLLNIFNGDKLTNTHCEPFTILIERGAAGLFCYVALFAAIIYRLLKLCDDGKETKKERAAIICALPIAAYFLNGMVSFATTISTPYFFILAGIAMSLSRSGQEQE